MSAKIFLVAILAALLGVAPLACTKDGGQGGAEAGAPSSGSTCGGGGARAVAELAALPGAAPAGGTDSGEASPIAGTATFAETGIGVDLAITITGCVNGNLYPVVIHEGAGCASAMSQGPEWDEPRGEGITPLTCTGNSGVGLLHYSRPNSDAKPWTVGAPSSSDVLGHVVVIDDPATMQPLACGAIGPAADDAGGSPAVPAAALPAVNIRAQLAGLCEVQAFSPGNEGGCPDPQKLSDCACTHCNLSACLSQCSAYATCLAGEKDAGCGGSCSMDPTCATCTGGMTQCLLGFCPDVLECAVPTPGGPCSKVEACCATQGPRAQQCLATIRQIEKLGGDTSCIGTMYDQDFLTHEAYDPPCNFDE